MRLRLPIILALVLAALIAPTARADTWPSKPIHVIMPFGAGSATDVVARIVLDQVSAQLGQAIVVENRAGAGSTTGSAVVAKAEPDGYLLLATSSAFSVVPSIYPNLPYDPEKDFIPIGAFGTLPNVLIVPADSPHKTVAEFAAWAKANPGKLNVATLGVGSAVHMAAERFRLSAGYQAANVAFKGGSEALTEIVAGRIDAYFCPSNTSLPFIRDGKVRALAVSTPKRLAALPDVPTTLESGFADSDYSSWVGLLVPANTPKEITDRLYKEVAEALKSEKVRERLEPNGIEQMSLTPAEFAAQIASEIKVAKAMAKAN